MTDINPTALRRETMQLINQINVQIEQVRAEAEIRNIPPEKLRDSEGNWAITPLLLAKAQAYSTLAILQAKKR